MDTDKLASQLVEVAKDPFRAMARYLHEASIELEAEERSIAARRAGAMDPSAAGALMLLEAEVRGARRAFAGIAETIQETMP